ncbi:MAG: hypothetical protein H8E26_01020 [FCB group bacterium]|nr:hypothetical protein [FCB group bacterium]MBL7029511.1 hypothetical protein [Candidatus Neomarinimicrobiota bacterium]MBL7122950.1 hypothetical protein [Candidatus Neomarinimicrobiota bacterium]
MKRLSHKIAVLALFLFGSTGLFAQPNFQFTIQSWASYTTYDHYAMNADSSALEVNETTTQFGSGIRRARLRGKMTKGKVTAFVQYDAVASYVLDAQIDYKFSDNLTMRMGRFVGAGSQAGGNTSHTAIDFAERSIVGRKWASAVGRSDYRTFGMAVMGKFSNFNYQIMAQNGDNSLNLLPYGTKSSNSDENTGAIPQLDFAISTKLSNGINVGLHYGLPNEDRINVSSATGFLYLQPRDYSQGKFRTKLDVARVVNHDSALDDVALGWGIGGFYKLSQKIELGTGYQSWDPNTDVDKDAMGNILLSAVYSPDPDHWKDSLFKLVATFKTAQADHEPLDPMVIHIVWQAYMH